MWTTPTRREWLLGATTIAGGLVTAGTSHAGAGTELHGGPAERDSFVYSFNTSTIMGQKLPLPEEVDIAAKAGYHAIEPWIREIERYVGSGGSLPDLKKRISDQGLRVESSIGFAEWIVDDDARRAKGLEDARRAMDLVRQLGGKRIAAPPVGATEQTNLNLFKAADRYRALAEVGANLGVVPQVEVWGFSKSLNRLSETVLVALESGHPDACVLPDVYHLYRGGSPFETLRVLGAATMHVFHLNDYPATPRTTITDAHRVFPGDGVAPLKPLVRDLRRIGFNGVLSLELFNPEYWKQDPFVVAKTGLEKMKTVVREAFA